MTSQPDEPQPVDAPETGRIAMDRHDPDPGRQWHDIQAMFVDDPQGSVQRAAQAADAAVSALTETLRQRQAALAPAATTSSPRDTEQLRAALRGYRVFCERLADLDEQLPRAEAMTSLDAMAS